MYLFLPSSVSEPLSELASCWTSDGGVVDLPKSNKELYHYLLLYNNNIGAFKCSLDAWPSCRLFSCPILPSSVTRLHKNIMITTSMLFKQIVISVCQIYADSANWYIILHCALIPLMLIYSNFQKHYILL